MIINPKHTTYPTSLNTPKQACLPSIAKLVFICTLLLTACQSAPIKDGSSATSLQLQVDTQYGKVTQTCANANDKANTRLIMVIKQWHLPPSTNTYLQISSGADIKHPQTKNQTSIYQQLDSWITENKAEFNSNQVKLFVEGCEGDIEQPDLKFNGWMLSHLKLALSTGTNYDQITTHMGLKVFAKHGDVLQTQSDTICADHNELMKENDLAFSDARAAIGFLTRIEELKTNQKMRSIYLEGAIETYKLSAKSTPDQVITGLKKELQRAEQNILKKINQRNQHLIQHIKKHSDKSSHAILVIGGAHADGLLELMNENKMSCAVIEPSGYEDALKI
jgi:hypothetical protein